jgi:cell division protease FtsH
MTHFSKISSATVNISQACGQISDNLNSSADWHGLAAAMLENLAQAPRAGWAFIEHVLPQAEQDFLDQLLPFEADERETVPLTEAKPSAGDDVDAMLDQIEQDLHGIKAPSAPAPDPWPVHEGRYRPRAAVLLAVMRLAKTFGTAEAFAEVMASPASLTVLCTIAPELERIVVKLLQRLISEAGGQGKAPVDTVFFTASEAVRGTGEATGQIFAALSDGMRNALEAGKPIVVIAPTPAILPGALKALSPSNTVTMAPLDRDMLRAMLQQAYPDDAGAAEALIDLLTAGEVSGLGADDLTLAFRVPDATEAVKFIAKRRKVSQFDEGLGLADFPLPKEVRAPVEQLVADIRAWQAGEIPWRDVSRGLLLVGPPGSGKTEIPRLIAKEAGVAVVAGSVAQWSSEGSRGSEVIKAMRGAFSQAAAKAPAVLFIDELDSFGDRTRTQDHNSSYTDYIVAALLDLLDGFRGHEGVVVMGATNHLGKIDAAIRRPGRFDTTVTLGYPDHTLMPQAIRWQLGGDLPDADLSEVAVAAVGMSGAEVAAMVRAARAQARKDRRPLTLGDLSAAIAAIRPPLPEDLHWQVAVHEAGHAIVGTATGLSFPDALAIVPTGGYCAQTDTTFAGHRVEIEALLAVDLAGRAAERLVLGQVSRGAGGSSSSDLARATSIAAALEISWGLGDVPVWLAPPEAAMAQMRRDPLLRTRVADHLKRAEALATNILQENRAALEEMATALMARKILSGADLEALTAKVVRLDGGQAIAQISEDLRTKATAISPQDTPGLPAAFGDFAGDEAPKPPEGPA